MRTPFAEFMSYTEQHPEPCPTCGTFGQRKYTEPSETEPKIICVNRYCSVSPFHDPNAHWPPHKR
ncbi:hypothetical protein OG508_28165 [Streptomyces sp. NBC_01108]|uniref:hypothetical protein n=1 Tax=Streptomyces sp. NBC_01108 TaxID=2903751 RepID=UPI003873C3F3|nr:hypothetical protein OG508_28165 [Streptomyces sp. NBC_01108]